MIAHDEASTTFDAILVLEFHLFKSLIAEYIALCRTSPNTHHVATIVAFGGVDDDVSVLVVVDIIGDKSKPILDIVFEETNLFLSHFFPPAHSFLPSNPSLAKPKRLMPFL